VEKESSAQFGKRLPHFGAQVLLREKNFSGRFSHQKDALGVMFSSQTPADKKIYYFLLTPQRSVAASRYLQKS